MAETDARRRQLYAELLAAALAPLRPAGRMAKPDNPKTPEEVEHAALVLAQDALEGLEDLAAGRVKDEAELNHALQRLAERMNGAVDD